MSTNLEIEAKAMIDKKDYKILVNEFSSCEKYNQVNYYICPKNQVEQKADFGLRIRKKNKKFELTIKQDLNDKKLEINQKISRKSYIFLRFFKKFPLGEVKNFLLENNVYNPDDLQIVGRMKTTRTDIEFEGALISIDKSKYLHKTDYEIECEDKTIDSANSKLKTFLENRNIKYEKSKLSKLARFLELK